MHVSGHASAGELRFVYNLVKPRFVMPVHGEWRHLVANAAVAQSAGIDSRRILVVDDGVSVDLDLQQRAVISGYTPVGFVYVDGSSIGDLTEASLKDRRVLGEEGFISIIAVVDIVAGTVVAGPEIHERGFGEKSSPKVDDVTGKVREALEQALADGIDDPHDLQQRMRRVRVGGSMRPTAVGR